MAFKISCQDKDERREEIIGKVQDGELSPAQANELAISEGLAPFERRPEVSSFDVLSMPVWNIEMVLAWIIWRDKEKVASYCEEYRQDWYYWAIVGTTPRPIQKGQRRLMPPRPKLGLRRHSAATLFTVQQDSRSRKLESERNGDVVPIVVQYDEAVKSLVHALQAGELVAHAFRVETMDSVKIDTHEWSHLRFETFSGLRRRPGSTRIFYQDRTDAVYRDVKAMRSDVVRRWKPSDGDASLEPHDGGPCPGGLAGRHITEYVETNHRAGNSTSPCNSLSR